MEFKRWVVYTSGEIQALLGQIKGLEVQGYDVILKIDTHERTWRDRSTKKTVTQSIPVAQLYKRKKGGGGELKCLPNRGRDAQILLQVSDRGVQSLGTKHQWFAQFHTHEMRYGTLFNGYSGVAGYLAKSDHLQLSPFLGWGDDNFSMIGALVALSLRDYEVSSCRCRLTRSDIRFPIACSCQIYACRLMPAPFRCPTPWTIPIHLKTRRMTTIIRMMEQEENRAVMTGTDLKRVKKTAQRVTPGAARRKMTIVTSMTSMTLKV